MLFVDSLCGESEKNGGIPFELNFILVIYFNMLFYFFDAFPNSFSFGTFFFKTFYIIRKI